MTPGKVVRIRLSPADCMAAVDVVRKLGGLPPGASFAQVVSLALGSAMQTLREHNVIPTRQGFEYTEMLAPFTLGEDRASRKRALEITRTLALAAPSAQVRPVAPGPAAPLHRARYEELAFKLQQDALNFTEADRSELTELTNQLFPEG